LFFDNFYALREDTPSRQDIFTRRLTNKDFRGFAAASQPASEPVCIAGNGAAIL
jgi:hypothetical protein